MGAFLACIRSRGIELYNEVREVGAYVYRRDLNYTFTGLLWERVDREYDILNNSIHHVS